MTRARITEVREAYEKAYGSPTGVHMLLGALSYYVKDEVLDELLEYTLKVAEEREAKKVSK